MTGVVIAVLTIVFVFCMVLSFRASLNLHIGLQLPGNVHVAWLTEALPFLIAVLAAVGLAWQLPSFGTRRLEVAYVTFLGLVLSVWLAWHPVSYSMDLLRYLWDGRLLTHGISPYRYVPADPHLAFLRNWPYWGALAWKEWPEAYPPIAQGYFWLAAMVTNGSAEAFKLLLVVNGVVSMVLFLRVLLIRHNRPFQLQYLTDRDIHAFTLFVLAPPILLESYGGGHVDALAIPWLLWAWGSSLRKQWLPLGIAMAVACALKLYPVVLFPAFWSMRDVRFIGKSLTAFTLMLCLLFLPVVSDVHGFLAYYTQVSQLDYNASLEPVLKSLLGPSVDTHSTLLVFVVELVMWALMLMTKLHELPLERKASLLGLTFFLASPLFHPWYLLSLLPFSIVGLDWATLWLAVASHLTYDEVVSDMNIEYVPTYLLFAWQVIAPWRTRKKQEVRWS